ncbi:glycosyltransferase family 4 protein [Spirosoma sp. KUDC1026]|uniref:glycosyltransferase family 4 protein n=1 Tax=Spirosoma sp. KUDC1026 TaxID=2745947 RepID=UPI00159BD0A3|nr:glycosyltransferase family 4 protein [Spirosoma sp. KUDC1026]QKZ15433.1 glycosyltransferase family 4 protein [Spirosoma sp. KUDC1026]
MKVLLTHPQTQHSYKIAKLLYECGILYKFYNPFVISNKNIELIPDFILNKIKTRIIEIPQNYIQTDLKFEIKKNIIRKIFKDNSTYRYFKFNEEFQNSISNKLISKADLTIGFDSSSWILANNVKLKNKKFILDRTIAHHSLSELIYSKSEHKYPEWSKQYKVAMTKEYIELENKELKLADTISVGGTFTKNSLIEFGVDEHKIHVNPYGVDINMFTPCVRKNKDIINFLFFGTIEARKGIPLLLSAWRKINTVNARLILAGYGNIPKTISLPRNVKLLGRIQPSDRNQLFSDSHVFVFPSLFEGFGQVLTEAALSGLPIITTYNTGGVELVQEGINGFLINANDEDALVERIQFFLDNPEKIDQMGVSRLQQIREKFSLDAYKDRWMKIIKLTVDNN